MALRIYTWLSVCNAYHYLWAENLPSPLMAIFDGGCSYSAHVLEKYFTFTIIKPAHAILILIALSSSECSGEPVQMHRHLHRLTRTFVDRILEVWM